MKSGVEGSLERTSEIGSLFSPSSFNSCPNSIPACQFFVSSVEFRPASTPCLNSAELVSTCCFMPSLIHSSFSLKIMSYKKLLNLLALVALQATTLAAPPRRDITASVPQRRDSLAFERISTKQESSSSPLLMGIESVQLHDCCA